MVRINFDSPSVRAGKGYYQAFIYAWYWASIMVCIWYSYSNFEMGDCEMKMHPMYSSNIGAIGYDPKQALLHVRFNSGKLYSYADVEQTTFNAFINAASVSNYFHTHIRNKYTRTRLRNDT